MRLSCVWLGGLLWLLALGTAVAAPRALAPSAAGPSTAFFYGARVPPELTQLFDRVVIDPDNLTAWPRGGRAELYAYVSVGEVDPGRPWRKRVPKGVVAALNREWGSEIVDPRASAWRSFLLDVVLPPIAAKGVKGLFLDTLDSFERLPGAAKDRAAHLRGLAELVDAIHARYPQLGLLFNRGFDLVPLVKERPVGIVAESLFQTGDPQGKHYQAVEADETRDLLRELRKMVDVYRLPVVVIDYVAPGARALRRQTARRILREGFEPYVSVPSLDQVGTGRVEPVPRHVMVLYKSDDGEESRAPVEAPLVAPALEWLGYVVDYVDVRGPLPEGPLVDRYAGIVVLAADDLGDTYAHWIERRLDEGVRVAFFLLGMGFRSDEALLERWQLTPASSTATPPLALSAANGFVGFEAQPRALVHDLPPYQVKKGARATESLLSLSDKDGHRWDAIVTGPWGGVAFSPYVMAPDLDEGTRLILDPFAFLTKALALEPMPAPDVTTESGRRLLTVHVDGDGFPSKAEFGAHDVAGRVLLDEVLKRYDLPHTVSVIEGEVGAKGLYPAQSAALETVAKEIFRLPYVEAASHTFSHPFVWADAEAHRDTPAAPASLPLVGYRFDAEREILGSLAYVNGRLLPRGQEARVLLWSGDCSPSDAVVALSERAGVLNVNGGGATITRAQPSLTHASPLGMGKGSAYQVFAPVQNENVFTNEWHGPFYGYEHAIETFEMTETPRRLGPISIYYHFFSATKTAALVALHKVYAWALAQETIPVYLSEYASRVLDVREVILGHRLDEDTWVVREPGDVRTLRLPASLGWPDLARSEGVAGVREVAAGRYVHLTSPEAAVLRLAPEAPRELHLVEANARVRSWERESVARDAGGEASEGNGARFVLQGHRPLRFSVASAVPCTLTTREGSQQAAPRDGVVHFALRESASGEAHLVCR